MIKKIYKKSGEIIDVTSIDLIDNKIFINKEAIKISHICYSEFSCGKCNKIEKRFGFNKNHIENFICKSCKTSETCLLKYGVSNPFGSTIVRSKTKKTKLERYGSENYNNTEKIQKTNMEKYDSTSNLHGINEEKIKKIKLDRYGSINNIEKILQTKLQKYGSKSYNNVHKAKLTKLERYGSENYNNIKKIQKTNMEKHGTKCLFLLESTKNKIKQTCLEKYGVENYFENSTIKYNKTYESFFFRERLNKVYPMFKKEEYIGQYHQYNWKCNICNDIFLDFCNNERQPRCLKCFPYISGFSNLEKEIVDYLKSLNLEIKENTHKIIKPLELDIYIPEKKLAIEFNGTYWHSTDHKNKWYHQMKVELCNRLNIRLLHIYEWEWKTNKQDCIDKINYYLNNEEKILPRKPEVKFIKDDQEVLFIDRQHTIWT